MVIGRDGLTTNTSLSPFSSRLASVNKAGGSTNSEGTASSVLIECLSNGECHDNTATTATPQDNNIIGFKDEKNRIA